MNCWAILRLDPTTDTRAIKKAYAVLLKQNRPDENPSGFQTLHDAYQQALDWARHQAEDVVEPPPPARARLQQQPKPVGTTDTDLSAPEYILPEQTTTEPEPPSEEELWENFLAEQWDILVDRIEQLLQQPSLRNRPQAWDFFSENEALLDIEFKSAFALRFLQRLLEIFKQQQGNGELILMPDIVRHLNGIFWWSERRHHYDAYFNPEELDDFFQWWQPRPAPTPQKRPNPVSKPAPERVSYGGYYVRWLALIVDVLPLILLAYGLNELGHWDTQGIRFAMIAGSIGYLLMSTLFEASRLQATPGKWLCRLTVCDPDGGPITFWRSLIRSLLFAICMRLLPITLIVNMLIWDGRLLHDRLSRSIVLKRQPK